MAVVCKTKYEAELNDMKLNYKFYLVLSLVFLIAFVVLLRMNSGYSYFFVGLGIGAALRSLYEYFKKGNQPR